MGMGPDDYNPDLTNEGFAEIVQMLSPLAAKYNQHLFHVFPMDERTMKAPREHYNFDETEEFRGDDKWSELRVGITYHGIRPPPTTDSRFTMRKPVTAESLATFIEEVEGGGAPGEVQEPGHPSSGRGRADAGGRLRLLQGAGHREQERRVRLVPHHL